VEATRCKDGTNQINKQKGEGVSVEWVGVIKLSTTEVKKEKGRGRFQE